MALDTSTKKERPGYGPGLQRSPPAKPRGNWT
jgi:hypothetical protein